MILKRRLKIGKKVAEDVGSGHWSPYCADGTEHGRGTAILPDGPRHAAPKPLHDPASPEVSGILALLTSRLSTVRRPRPTRLISPSTRSAPPGSPLRWRRLGCFTARIHGVNTTTIALPFISAAPAELSRPIPSLHPVDYRRRAFL